MLSKYKYTDKEKKLLLRSIGLLVDTREKKNDHIVSWLEKKKIPYKKIKLDQGDYSFYIPKNKDLHIERDMYFHNDICIERKGSLEELSTNLTSKRSQFKHELSHYNGDMLLLIENGTYGDIAKGNYRTELSSGAYIGSLHSLTTEFCVPFIFIEPEHSGQFIYLEFYYYLRNIIK